MESVRIVTPMMPKGEAHHASVITEATATRIKKLLTTRTVAKVSEKTGVKYQIVYRIAMGITWADVPPKGAVKPKGATRGPRRRLTLKTWYLLWKLRRAGAPYSKLSAKLGLSTGSLHRLVREFEAMLGARVSQLHLTSGTYEPAVRKYGLKRSEAERLDHAASASPLLPRLQRIVDTEFEALETELAGR